MGRCGTQGGTSESTKRPIGSLQPLGFSFSLDTEAHNTYDAEVVPCVGALNVSVCKQPLMHSCQKYGHVPQCYTLLNDGLQV